MTNPTINTIPKLVNLQYHAAMIIKESDIDSPVHNIHYPKKSQSYRNLAFEKPNPIFDILVMQRGSHGSVIVWVT